VTVSAGEVLVETTKTDLSRVVSEREIESLPNIGRNFVDFVKLSSGVALGRENIGGGPFKEPDTGVGASAAPRLSFGGQQELNTLVQVDGVDNVQTYTGLPRATPSQEAVREFRILNSTYLAEYGRALGGFVNIVTKSGTNEYRGSAYYYGMNDAFASRSALSAPGTDGPSPAQFGRRWAGCSPRIARFFANTKGRCGRSRTASPGHPDNLNAINAVRALNLRPGRWTRSAPTTTTLPPSARPPGLRDADPQRRYLFLDSEALNFPAAAAARPGLGRAQQRDADHAAVVTATSCSRPAPERDAVQYAQRSYDFCPLRPSPRSRSPTGSSWARPPPTWTSTRRRGGRPRAACSSWAAATSSSSAST
jgi:hypothetical protein